MVVTCEVRLCVIRVRPECPVSFPAPPGVFAGARAGLGVRPRATRSAAQAARRGRGALVV